MNSPLVSIIIPAFNRAHIVNETVNSVLAQTYTNWECIVVDDGSTDATVQIIEKCIKEDNRFQIKTRTPNRKKGPSSCRNIGIEIAKGELIIFLDSDDLISSVCIQNRVDFYLQQPNYDFYIFKSDIFYEHEFHNQSPFNPSLTNYSDHDYFKLFSLGKTPFCVMSPLWKLSTLEKLNGFDENLMILEDPDLHYRAFQNSMKSLTHIGGIADSYYRVRTEKQIKNKHNADKIASGYLYYCNKHLNYKNENFKNFSFKCMGSIFLSNKYVSISKVNQFYFLLLKFRVLTYKQIIFQPVILFFVFFKLNSIKGLGFYKLTKYLYK